MIMMSKISTDWPTFLPSVVDALNQKPLKALGNSSPSEINNELDDAKVRNAQKRNHVQAYEETDWKEQEKSQEDYMKSNNPLQIGQHVYLDKKVEVFDKSFFAQVSHFCSF